MKLRLVGLFTALSIATTTLAQTPGSINEGSQIHYDSLIDQFAFSWWGVDGRTYFVKSSTDLMEWAYVPIIEPGDDQVIQWNFELDNTSPITGEWVWLPDIQDWVFFANTERETIFLRLAYVDIPVIVDVWQDDFDGDTIGNEAEFIYNTDPLLWDTDGDLVHDGLEIASSNLDPTDASDSDNDSIEDDWERFWFGGLDVVSEANPVFVSAGGSYSVDFPGQDTVQLNGAVKTPKNFSNGLSLLWSKVSGPGSVVFQDASEAITDATFSVDGLYQLRLTASVSGANVSSDAFVSVEGNSAPDISFVAPQEGGSYELGSTILLWVNASDDGTIPTVDYYENGALLDTTSSPYLLNVTASNAGNFTYTAVANDNDGNTSSTSVSITVQSSSPPGGGDPGGGNPGGSFNEPLPGEVNSLGKNEEGPFPGTQILSLITSGEGTQTDQDIFTANEPGNYLIEVIVSSAEYPDYTGDSSEYNDSVSWSFSAPWSGTYSGAHSVNSLHDDFAASSTNEASVAMYEINFPSDAEGSDLTISFNAAVSNIGDGSYDTSVTFRVSKLELSIEADAWTASAASSSSSTQPMTQSASHMRPPMIVLRCLNFRSLCLARSVA